MLDEMTGLEYGLMMIYSDSDAVKVDSGMVAKSIKHYGNTEQCIVTMEECAELIQVISKLLRGKNTEQYHLCEEIADVYICLENLKQIYRIGANDIRRVIRRKQDRTEERIITELEEDISPIRRLERKAKK